MIQYSSKPYTLCVCSIVKVSIFFYFIQSPLLNSTKEPLFGIITQMITFIQTFHVKNLTKNKIRLHLPLLVSRKKFFFKSNSHVSTHPLSITDVRDFRHESPNLLEIILSGSQMPSFTYPSDIVCVDPDVGDGVLWTRGRLSSVERSKPMVSRFTFNEKKLI